MLLTCGAFSRRLTTGGKHTSKHFDENGAFRLKRIVDGEEVADGAEIIPMDSFPIPKHPVLEALEDALPRPRRENSGEGEGADTHQATLRIFADLLASCLIPNPAKRA